MWEYAALLLVIGVAIGGATYAVWRQPDFWAGLLVVLVKAALPAITKQMTPDQQAEWHAAERRGEGDKYMRDHLRKKLKPIFGGRNAGSG